ncbi:triose-phosphate isomerase [Sphingomonas lenta]|uniref:Triosephosphate isomerase n=1 Tax=Sphingomonas lenta TaxID=1141887 RepID=A0A2A2SJL4_9SPHN|nr:triose-phosphate isomerase [Sphingomonas lenta]PAX09350.1 triose-phosphate isomerase [Sphingomonas lenta]
MRRKLIAGNWKMNGSLGALAELDAIEAAATGTPGVDVAVAVPATLINPAVERVSAVAIGAQDVHQGECGAHTGCISAVMVREVGARFSIVGHSERRADQAESDAHVKGKAEAARAAGLSVILCVGESLEDRDAGRAEQVVTDQLARSLPQGAAGEWLSVAYEPIWAIGTGRTPTVEDVAAMHGALRARLRELAGGEADAIRLLYGGSVNDANAAALLGAGDVDGALVGGASLTAAKFVPIIEAAAKLG